MSEIKKFEFVVKLNGQLLECDGETLDYLTTSSKTLTVGQSSASVNTQSGWFSSGGLRGFKKAGGDVEAVKKFIIKKMKQERPAREIVDEIDKEWGAVMDKNVCYKLYNATPKVTRRK